MHSLCYGLWFLKIPIQDIKKEKAEKVPKHYCLKINVLCIQNMSLQIIHKNLFFVTLFIEPNIIFKVYLINTEGINNVNACTLTCHGQNHHFKFNP